MPAEQAFLIGLLLGTVFGVFIMCAVFLWLCGVDRELVDTVEPPVSR